MHFQDVGGEVEIDRFFFTALGLHVAELFECPFELTRETLLVHAERAQCARLFAEGVGRGEGDVGLGMIGDDVIGMLGHAEAEQTVFERGNAVEAPGSVGERLDELVLDHALGLEVVEESLREELVGVEILGRQDDHVTSESVAKSVQRGAVFAGLSAGASRMLRIGAIDGGAICVGVRKRSRSVQGISLKH